MVKHSACCDDNLSLKKSLWTAEEDAKVLAYVSKHGTGNWTAVPKKAGLKRCGKSCRLRYTNYLRPDLNHDIFTHEEEEMIVKLHSAIGSRWSIIAQQLPGRTDNDVKNYWNTKLKKKLSEKGIDPVTHKPFSQILADYGNIGGGFPTATGAATTTRVGSLLNRELKNAFMMKSEYDQPQLLTSYHEVDSYLNNMNSSTSTSNNSLDLLAQLQAIQRVTTTRASSSYDKTEQSGQEPDRVVDTQNSAMFSPPSSPPLSSSSSARWQDFLLEDMFSLPVVLSNDNNRQECTIMQGEMIIISDDDDDRDEKISEKTSLDDSSTLSSDDARFVETMLERDNAMLCEFPSILEETIYY